jgi:hypothetical protein
MRPVIQRSCEHSRTQDSTFMKRSELGVVRLLLNHLNCSYNCGYHPRQNCQVCSRTTIQFGARSWILCTAHDGLPSWLTSSGIAKCSNGSSWIYRRVAFQECLLHNICSYCGYDCKWSRNPHKDSFIIVIDRTHRYCFPGPHPKCQKAHSSRSSSIPARGWP